MAPHSSTLAWKIPWTEEPGRLQSMRSLRVGHDWTTSLSLFTFMHWRRKLQPTPVFLPGECQGWGSLMGCRLWGRTGRTQLKRLSSSSPGGSDGKESTCNAGDLGLIPRLWRSLGEGHGSLLQYSCLENPHGQRCLADYSPRGRKELDINWATKHRVVRWSRL